MGMFLGGMWHAKSAFKAGMQSMKTNIPVSGNTRYFERSYSSNLVKELRELKELHHRDFLARQEAGENVFG